MRNRADAIEARGAGSSGLESGREQPGEERVLSLGGRRLTSWAWLERFVCRIDGEGKETRVAIAFRVRVALQEFFGTLLKSERDQRPLIHVHGENGRIHVAGRVLNCQGYAWFGQELQLRLLSEELEVTASEPLWLGPTPPGEFCLAELLRERAKAGAKGGNERDKKNIRAMEGDDAENIGRQVWRITVVESLLASLRKNAGMTLPGKILRTSSRMWLEGEQLRIEGDGFDPDFALEEGRSPEAAGPPGDDGTGLEKEFSSGAAAELPENQLMASLKAEDFDQARLLLSDFDEESDLGRALRVRFALRCQELDNDEVAFLRRLARSGHKGAAGALAIHLIRQGRLFRAYHWYQRLESFCAGEAPVLAWAVQGATKTFVSSLTVVDSGTRSPSERDDGPSDAEERGPDDRGGPFALGKASSEQFMREPASVMDGERRAAEMEPAASPWTGSFAKSPGQPEGFPDDDPELTLEPAETETEDPVETETDNLVGNAVVQALFGEDSSEVSDEGAASALALLNEDRLTVERLATVREAFESREDWRGLLRVLSEALRSAKTPACENLLHRELAQVKIALGVPSRAVGHYEAILAAIPDDADAVAFLRKQYQRQGDYDARIRLDAQLAQRLESAEASRTLQSLADEARQHQLRGLERGLLVQACEIHPSDGVLLTRLTEMLEPAEEWEVLLDLWSRRLELLILPEEKVAVGLKVSDYMLKCEDLEGAEIILRGLVRNEPEHPEVLDGLARVFEGQGRWADAAEMLERRTRLVQGEDRVDVALRLAEIYASYLDEPETADGWYREALAEVPGDLRAAEGLIRQLEGRGNWIGLVSFLEGRLLSVDDPEERKELLEYLGDVYAVRLKDHEQARNYFLQAEAILELPKELANGHASDSGLG